MDETSIVNEVIESYLEGAGLDYTDKNIKSLKEADWRMICRLCIRKKDAN